MRGSTKAPAGAGRAVAASHERVGFGTWTYGAAADEERVAALREAHALGCTFYDTSNLYGWGHAEALLGVAFEGIRENVRIATKAGYTSADGAQDFSPDAVRRSLDGSLQRLRTEYVDLLQLHNPAPEQVTDRLVSALQADGRLRAWGISARTPDEALALVERFSPAAVQVNFNLGDLRAARNGLFDTCAAAGIAVVARTPLAAGFLTGTLGADASFSEDDQRARFDEATRLRWLSAAERMQPAFADVPGATPAQNALRFCLSFDAVSYVIPGMTTVSQVRENMAAARLPRLSQAQLATIASVYDAIFV